MTPARIINFVWWIALSFLVAAHLVIAWRSLTVMQFWEDEAYNLTVPLNMLRGLGYASDGMLNGSADISLFDARISTGPVVLVPVAAVMQLMSLFGFELWGQDVAIVSRIVPLAYWALLIGGLYLLGQRIAGRWGALLAVTAPIAFTAAASYSPIQGPADLLGEIPAAALCVWAFIALRSRPWLAGLLFGFAIQAKYIALLAGPALVVAALILAAQPLRRWWRVLLAPAIFTVVPTLLIELVTLITLGPAGYLNHLREVGAFLLGGGQLYQSTTITEKLETLMGSWFIPPWPALTISLVVVALISFAITLTVKHPQLLHHARLRLTGRSSIAEPRELVALLAGATLGVLAFAGWWATAAHTPLWARHPAPGMFAFVPVIAAFAPLAFAVMVQWFAKLSAMGSEPSRGRSTRIMVGALGTVISTVNVFAVSFLAVSLHLQHSLDEPAQTLNDQHAAAAEMRSVLLAHDSKREGWVAAEIWGSAVSIGVLTGLHTGLGDHPDMARVPYISPGDCQNSTQLAQAGGYVLCQPN